MAANNQLNALSTSFTPTLTFATPGNLSVVYATKVGTYLRIAETVWINIQLTCTPTFTTASGNLRIASLPLTVSGASYIQLEQGSTGLTWPATVQSVFGNTSNGSTFMTVQGLRLSNSSSNFTTSAVVSGAPVTLNFSGVYLTSD